MPMSNEEIIPSMSKAQRKAVQKELDELFAALTKKFPLRKE